MRAEAAYVAVAATSGASSQQQPNTALQLLARLSAHSTKVLSTNSAVTTKFLSLVHSVFADRELRKSEAAQKLQFAFFAGRRHLRSRSCGNFVSSISGLNCQDREVRNQFFRLFETQFPSHLYDRLMYTIGEQNWLPFASHFWIPHALQLLMRAALSSTAAISATTAEKTPTLLPPARIELVDCAKLTSSALDAALGTLPEGDGTEMAVEESQATAADKIEAAVDLPTATTSTSKLHDSARL